MLMTKAKKHDHAELEEGYNAGIEIDGPIYADMRSNVLLISGEHYAKKNSKVWQRIKGAEDLAEEQKIRITKNHIQRIVKTYVNNIITYAPGVAILPQNKGENADVKAAELHQAVWQDAKDRHDLDEKVGEWADDFVGIGEVITKIYWEEHAGPIVAYEAETGEDGKIVYDENQQPNILRPKFRGDLCFEDIYGFNLIRPRDCKDMQKSPWLGIRKMTEIKKLQAMVGTDAAKLKMIAESSETEYIVFDAANAGYGNSKGMVLVKEYYFRPCLQYPKGWYFITTSSGILFDGELPFGIFPLVLQTFEKPQTAPRGRSIVKVLRPYQIEINRGSSKIAEHQMTLGDDKVLIQKGTKLEQGGVLPGIRGVTYAGKEPKIMEGRSGAQYLEYVNSQITEMYSVAMVKEDSAEKNVTVDPYAMLFASADQRKKFVRYTKRFEKFLQRVCKTYLSLAKEYLPDDAVIQAIGRREQINISEFKNSEDLCYQIRTEPQSDDVETKFGKLLSINHTLQYVGSQLDKEDIGKLLRANPYANEEASFKDFTQDFDNATNEILALDRGALPLVHKNDNHKYILGKLASRQKEGDYDFLSPAIQSNYEITVQKHEFLQSQQLAALKAEEADFIPVDGPMIACDFYVEDAANPGKDKRARIPFRSIQWLIQRMEHQGMTLQHLEDLPQGVQSDIAGMTPPAPHSGAPGMDAQSPYDQQGAKMPVGASSDNDSARLGLKQPEFQHASG